LAQADEWPMFDYVAFYFGVQIIDQAKNRDDFESNDY